MLLYFMFIVVAYLYLIWYLLFVDNLFFILIIQDERNFPVTFGLAASLCRSLGAIRGILARSDRLPELGRHTLFRPPPRVDRLRLPQEGDGRLLNDGVGPAVQSVLST